ncbi:PilT/PilU family type 4a pilus ATPase [Planctomycetales bacterium ZRK34]|nr:PilT/PilU family type 4a pilus ATPase [Planctomycetales bacterium ZRK34]
MSDAQSATPLNAYLSRMVQTDASDVFLRPGDPPTYRINGDLVQLDMPAPTEGDLRAWVDQLLTPIAKQRFETSPDIDVAYTIPQVGRFRVAVFMQQGQLALVARLIPTAKLEFDSLGLPRVIRDMVEKRRGLILVVGPTGCGKSTTLASLIHHINATRREHIVTIEDPIEFIHEPIQSLIHQRQVGYDTESFATALRHVVRQSPDVILIGEMRDRDTMETALNAALTGHLVLSTLHTTSVVQSIDRILNYFPADARGQAQADLAATLIGMVSMRLLPRSDGKGRAPAVEVLLGTSTIRRLITEGNFIELYDVMKRGHSAGMITLNQSLVNLTKRGLVDEVDAAAHSPNPDEFRLNMQGMFTGVDSLDIQSE